MYNLFKTLWDNKIEIKSNLLMSAALFSSFASVFVVGISVKGAYLERFFPCTDDKTLFLVFIHLQNFNYLKSVFSFTQWKFKLLGIVLIYDLLWLHLWKSNKSTNAYIEPYLRLCLDHHIEICFSYLFCWKKWLQTKNSTEFETGIY